MTQNFDSYKAGPKTDGLTNNASNFTLEIKPRKWHGSAGRHHVQATPPAIAIVNIQSYFFFLFPEAFFAGAFPATFFAGFAAGFAGFASALAALDFSATFAGAFTGGAAGGATGAGATAAAAFPFFPFGPGFAGAATATGASAAPLAARPRRGAGGGGGGGGANGFRNFSVSVRERSFPSSKSRKTSCASFGYTGNCGVISNSVISGNGSFCCT